MDAKVYLQSFGWKEGEALQSGGIRKPILVKHKKDTKGLGGDSNDGDMWWERVFDTQLTNLEVTNNSVGVYFKLNNQDVLKDLSRPDKSVLYRMFVKGEGLKGTLGTVDQVIAKASFVRDHTPDIVKKLEQKINGNKEEVKKVKSKKRSSKKEKTEGKEEKKERKRKIPKESNERKEKKDKKVKKDKSKVKDKIGKVDGVSKSKTSIKLELSVKKNESKSDGSLKRSRSNDNERKSKKNKKRRAS